MGYICRPPRISGGGISSCVGLVQALKKAEANIEHFLVGQNSKSRR